jgi:hypothetical protein
MFIVKLTFLKLSFFLGLSCLRNTDDFSKKIEIGKKKKKNFFFIFSVWHFICLSLYLFDIVTEFERSIVSQSIDFGILKEAKPIEM